MAERRSERSRLADVIEPVPDSPASSRALIFTSSRNPAENTLPSGQAGLDSQYWCTWSSVAPERNMFRNASLLRFDRW